MPNNEIMVSVKKLEGYYTINFIVRSSDGKVIDNGTHKYGVLMDAMDSMEALKHLLAKYL